MFLSLGNPPSRGGARTGGRYLGELSLVHSVGITLPHLLQASILWDGSILIMFLKVEFVIFTVKDRNVESAKKVSGSHFSNIVL